MEPGWLTSESVVQLKMFNSPVVLWKRKYQSLPLSYKVTPIDLAASTADAPAVVEENEQHSNVSDFECVKWPVIEIAVMKEGECEFKHQNQFGNLYAPEDFVVFQAQVLDPTSITTAATLWHDSSFVGGEEASSAVCPSLPALKKTLPTDQEGSALVSLTPKSQRPLPPAVSYLIVRPLVGYSCNCRQTFSKLWKKTNRSLDVGHRGAGHARRTDKYAHSCTSPLGNPQLTLFRVENVLENTVASFNYAAKHVSPRMHSFCEVLHAGKRPTERDPLSQRKSPVQEEEKLKLAVKDLTACQLQRLKLSPACEGAQQGSSAHGYDFREDDLEDNQPFPTLQHVLEAVDPSVGFNVEIKCPMQFRDGTWEMDLNFDMNQYLDIVLKTLLDFSGKRYIILSCFHPDICTMIRLKQNKYPLLFLTQGQTEKYPAYLDTRTSSVQMATYFAMCTHILGINVHTEELLKQPTLIPFVKQHKLILFCWGEDNNHSGTITCLKRKGVDGVIYDKLDVLIGNSRENENVFLVHPSATVSMLEAAASCSRESQPENTVAATPACSVGSS
ncbi:glycerophosphoryl diester phosphodiesterase, putative [Ixodes scapularis]|uniref:Glycerophosphoryl diester phosphodiesterase, putative n=1 Tax=Ixodes scapularis TaxID=6945 RepID=B7PNT8_IXOSC|nr:glycerophosphoryl diester phosphodiesterase, putative [Ixodes scapularis]|eukprot:XP_002435430.1 glycerophosphoryl diester phosphodiesterase, putative [Ixodes scapularis]